MTMMKKKDLIACMIFITKDNVSKLEVQYLNNKRLTNTHLTITILKSHKSQIVTKNSMMKMKMVRI